MGPSKHSTISHIFFVKGKHFFKNARSSLKQLFQKFRKGVGEQRGLARGNPSKARDSGLFSVPFFLYPLRRMGTHLWRTFWALFGGLFVANPFPPTPFRNLRLFRSSLKGMKFGMLRSSCRPHPWQQMPTMKTPWLFFEALQKDPLKQASNIISRGYFHCASVLDVFGNSTLVIGF